MENHETAAVENAKLRSGAAELLDFLQNENIPFAIVTNNCTRNVHASAAKCGISIPIVVSRDDGPFKPSPALLAIAAARINVDSSHCVMLGDSWIDAASARAMGMKVILLGDPGGDARPDFNATDMHAALELLKKMHVAGETWVS